MFVVLMTLASFTKWLIASGAIGYIIGLIQGYNWGSGEAAQKALEICVDLAIHSPEWTGYTVEQITEMCHMSLDKLL